LFYLYLLTNEKTKQCGIYEISKKQISFELGYSIDRVSKLLKYFIDSGRIMYNDTTKEVALKNWNKFNGSTSPKVLSCIKSELNNIKDTVLIQYVNGIYTASQEEQEEEQEEDNKVSDETFNSESQNKTLTDKEIIEKFISWFNKRIVNHKGKEGKFKKLDKTDLNNYKELLKLYPDGNDWIHAFNMMMESEWIKANDTASPKHFLINANFQNYVNKTSSRQKSVYIPQNDLN